MVVNLPAVRRARPRPVPACWHHVHGTRSRPSRRRSFEAWSTVARPRTTSGHRGHPARRTGHRRRHRRPAAARSAAGRQPLGRGVPADEDAAGPPRDHRRAATRRARAGHDDRRVHERHVRPGARDERGARPAPVDARHRPGDGRPVVPAACTISAPPIEMCSTPSRAAVSSRPRGWNGSRRYARAIPTTTGRGSTTTR